MPHPAHLQPALSSFHDDLIAAGFGEHVANDPREQALARLAFDDAIDAACCGDYAPAYSYDFSEAAVETAAAALLEE